MIILRCVVRSIWLGWSRRTGDCWGWLAAVILRRAERQRSTPIGSLSSQGYSVLRTNGTAEPRNFDAETQRKRRDAENNRNTFEKVLKNLVFRRSSASPRQKSRRYAVRGVSSLRPSARRRPSPVPPPPPQTTTSFHPLIRVKSPNPPPILNYDRRPFGRQSGARMPRNHSSRRNSSHAH